MKENNTYCDLDLVGYGFTYRKPNGDHENKIGINWVDNRNTKMWRIRPDPPKELPNGFWCFISTNIGLNVFSFTDKPPDSYQEFNFNWQYSVVAGAGTVGSTAIYSEDVRFWKISGGSFGGGGGFRVGGSFMGCFSIYVGPSKYKYGGTSGGVH